MNRYFLEVAYKGTRYAGFQVQQNANTVQGEVEKALAILLRQPVMLTGSSRTDAGVHAWQNYFHFDVEKVLNPAILYNINALLPGDIAVKNLVPVKPVAHSRFDAITREYEYHIYQAKDPFLADRGYYFPYALRLEILEEVAAMVTQYTDFTSFAKRNSQVHTFNCRIITSTWQQQQGRLIYRVKANRFLRGMVRGLVGTMLQAGRGKITTQQFRQVVEALDCSRADFSVPGHGLFLVQVAYPEGYFEQPVPITGRGLQQEE